MGAVSNRRQIFLYLDQEHCLSVHGNTVLSFSLQPPNPHYLAAWTEAMDHQAKRSLGPLSVMTVVDARCRPPDDTSKQAIRNTILRHSSHIGAFAYVVEGNGFGAAAIRSAVTLISLMARYPFPQKVFKEVRPACVWTLDRVPPEPERETSAAGMTSAIQGMRFQVTQLAATG